ncbi:MAG: DUF1059 domain-containing protein [Elusimicrobia bacterium]|nr:DUF1059 domain-containing protein [Elusimicrobiota bacterium]
MTIDCRDSPEANCSLAISGTESEVMECAELHATTKHGMKEPGLRDQLRSMIKREAFSR